MNDNGIRLVIPSQLKRDFKVWCVENSIGMSEGVILIIEALLAGQIKLTTKKGIETK